MRFINVKSKRIFTRRNVFSMSENTYTHARYYSEVTIHLRGRLPTRFLPNLGKWDNYVTENEHFEKKLWQTIWDGHVILCVFHQFAVCLYGKMRCLHIPSWTIQCPTRGLYSLIWWPLSSRRRRRQKLTFETEGGWSNAIAAKGLKWCAAFSCVRSSISIWK